MKYKIGDKVTIKYGIKKIYSIYAIDDSDSECMYKLKRADDDTVGWCKESSIELVETDPHTDIKECDTDLLKAEYERGLDDAWELLRQLRTKDPTDIIEIFDKYATYSVVEELSASEAVAKWKAWEEKNKIKVGDEVILNANENHENVKAVVLTYYGSVRTYNVLLNDGNTEWVREDAIECKIGHFDQITEILKQMKEKN